MPHVIGLNGRDLGDITNPALLAYYRGEGYQIDGDPVEPMSPHPLPAPRDSGDALLAATPQTPESAAAPVNPAPTSPEENPS